MSNSIEVRALQALVEKQDKEILYYYDLQERYFKSLLALIHEIEAHYGFETYDTLIHKVKEVQQFNTLVALATNSKLEEIDE